MKCFKRGHTTKCLVATKRNRGPKALRRFDAIQANLYVAQNGFCFYCGMLTLLPEDLARYINATYIEDRFWSPHDMMTIEHLVPLCEGGSQYDLTNIVGACGYCNQKRDIKPWQPYSRWARRNLQEIYFVKRRFWMRKKNRKAYILQLRESFGRALMLLYQ